MAQLQSVYTRISDFIFNHPDVVVVLLQQNGYDIDMETATLSQINKLVYQALIDGNTKFASDFDMAYWSEGQNNFVMVALAVAGLATSIIGQVSAKKQAEKTRELQKQMKIADLALQEKLALEKLRIEQENTRTNILANSLLEYRKTLQTESTARLKDTWLYVTALGVGFGIFYGLFLLTSKD